MVYRALRCPLVRNEYVLAYVIVSIECGTVVNKFSVRNLIRRKDGVDQK